MEPTMIEQSAPKLKAPRNSCDCHMHVYDASYPTAKTARVLPPPASVEQYLAARKNLGIERTIVVQASAYGTDNSLLLKSMSQIGPGARGIVVLDDTVSDEKRYQGLGTGCGGKCDMGRSVRIDISDFGMGFIFGHSIATRLALGRGSRIFSL